MMNDVERCQQLLPNPDFREGLRGWEPLGPGTALVISGEQQLLQLSSGSEGPARLFSQPVQIVEGASYLLESSLCRLEGKGTLRVLWCDAQLKPLRGTETPLKLGSTGQDVTAPNGAKYVCVGVEVTAGSSALNSVKLTPVGPRLKIQSFDTLQPVLQSGKPGLLKCLVANCGSETLVNPVIELREGRELRVPGADPEKTLPALEPGHTAAAVWPILVQEPGIYPAIVRVRCLGCSDEWGTDVVVGEEPVRVDTSQRGIRSRRSFVTMSSPNFRVVFPRMEFGFGLGQFELGDPFRFAGWIRSLGSAVGPHVDPPRCLLAKRSRLSGATLSLVNHDRLAAWEVSVTPKPERSRLSVHLEYTACEAHELRELHGICFCLPDGVEPLDCESDERGYAVTLSVGGKTHGVAIHWRAPELRGDTIEGSKTGGRIQLVLRPKRQHLTPGSRLQLRQEVWMGRADTAREALER